MLRLAEIGLLLGPLAVAFLWLRLARGDGPPRRVVVAAVCGLAVMTGWLLWLTQQDRFGRSETYVPAQAVDGRIVPGHAVR